MGIIIGFLFLFLPCLLMIFGGLAMNRLLVSRRKILRFAYLVPFAAATFLASLLFQLGFFASV
jgi:ABC-type sugar transport system permease subunit